ncbi:MAG: hypothetical protein KDB53_14090 [Planctomycetes bacterium]|nr:hypothetical protein [Planctomycetota bacterium]
MHLVFRCRRDDPQGRAWKELFVRSWPAYRAWYLAKGSEARPDLATCRAALLRHMPELVPEWNRRVEWAAGDETAARMLSLYRPPAIIAGCTQATLTEGPVALIRNYDYHPQLCEGTIFLGQWNETQVLASSDCLWGVLDGMNDRGLAVALSFGGRPEVGDGFAVTLILRYVLEICGNVDEAAEVLARVPCFMAYNVTLLDAQGMRAVVEIGPDRPARVVKTDVATNHQTDAAGWEKYEELSQSQDRRGYLESLLSEPRPSAEDLLRAFLEPPLFRTRYDRGCGTLYTALYFPAEGRVEYHWPSQSLRQSLTAFRAKTVGIDYSD